METGDTMVEIIRATNTTGTTASNMTTNPTETHEGIKQYYVQKIEELQVNELVSHQRFIECKKNNFFSFLHS